MMINFNTWPHGYPLENQNVENKSNFHKPRSPNGWNYPRK